MKMKEILLRALSEIINILSYQLRIRINDDGVFLNLIPAVRNELPLIDDRLEGLENARANLLNALCAIDDLKSDAETTKAELKVALEKLKEAEHNRNLTSNELKELEKIKDSDIGLLKGIIGVPSKKQIAIERVIAFLLGVSASLLASYLWDLFK